MKQNYVNAYSTLYAKTCRHALFGSYRVLVSFSVRWLGRPSLHMPHGVTCGVHRTPLRVTHVTNTPLAFHSELRTCHIVRATAIPPLPAPALHIVRRATATPSLSAHRTPRHCDPVAPCTSYCTARTCLCVFFVLETLLTVVRGSWIVLRGWCLVDGAMEHGGVRVWSIYVIGSCLLVLHY